MSCRISQALTLTGKFRQTRLSRMHVYHNVVGIFRRWLPKVAVNTGFNQLSTTLLGGPARQDILLNIEFSIILMLDQPRCFM